MRDFAVRAAAPKRRADALLVIRFAGQGDDAVRFCQRQRLIMRAVDVPDVFVHAERNGDDAVMCRRDDHALCEQMHPLHRAEPFLPDGDFARIRLERAFAGEHAVGNIEREAVRRKPIGIFRQRHAFHGDIQRIRGIQRLFPALPFLVVDAREVDGGHLLYARFANRPANAHIPIARQEAVAVIRVLCRVKARSLNHRIHPFIPPHVQNFPPCGIHGGKFAAALRFSCYGLQVSGCGNFGSAQYFRQSKSQSCKCASEGVKGAIADFVCFHCPLSPPQRRNPLRMGKNSHVEKSGNPVAPIWRDNVQVVDRAAWGRV